MPFYSMPTEQPTIFLLEDQALLLELLERFGTSQGCKIIGKARNGNDAIAACIENPPNLILADIYLPTTPDGIAVVETIRKRHPSVKAILLSSRRDPYTILRALAAPVHGFVDKHAEDLTVFERAISKVLAGETFFSEAVREVRKQMAHPNAFPKVLTQREIELVPLLASGLSDDELAEHVGITSGTAKNHRKHILRKLKLGSTPKLMDWARKTGFIADGA